MNNNATAIPHNYEACLTNNCPQREHCLRAWVWDNRKSSVQRYVVLNPDLTTSDGHCPFYCDDQPQRYALGFTNFQRRLYPDQYKQFMSACIARFGRNPYFMRRRGDTPMSPSEQAFIRSVLKQIGAPEDIDFDGFEERINWYGD
ncbi:MAG: DUF6078 family protein [Prevotella sp.]|nr:DUF6078 family protein [Prevotella sp.]